MNTPADFTKTWRYKVGLTMIIAGNGVILLALLLPLLTVKHDSQIHLSRLSVVLLRLLFARATSAGSRSLYIAKKIL